MAVISVQLRAGLRALTARIPKSKFLRQVGALSFSTAIAQAISLFVGPINSRLYTPADFGLLAPFASLFSVLTVLITMRYEMAMPVAADDQEGLNVFSLCMVLTFVWCAAIAIVIGVFGPQIAAHLSQDPG